jgi:hypothetical protein
VEELKYLETKLTNQNSIQEQVEFWECLLSFGAEYFPSGLLTKNLNIKTYRIIILPLLLHECKTWSHTLREERRLKMFENGVLRIIFGPKRDEVTRE